MERINWGRVVTGGLIAGLIVNVLEMVLNGMILADRWPAVLQALNRSTEFSVKQLAAFNGLGFATGIFAVWLYAAIRPRYGEGVRTAAIAGAAVWLLGYVLASGGPVVMHIFPVDLIATAIAFGLAEIVLATIVGARFYKEAAAPQSARSAVA